MKQAWTAWLPVFFLVAACSRDDPLARPTTRIENPSVGGPQLSAAGVPEVQACLPEGLPIRPAILREVAGVLAEDRRAMPGRNDGYLPGALRDLAAGPEGRVYALDGQRQIVWTFSPTLAVEGSWGGRGEGPSEMRGPVALAVDADGTVVVAEQSPPGLARFSPDGSLVLRAHVATSPSDVEIGEDGTVYLSHDVLRSRRGRRSPRPVLTRYDPSFQPIDTLLSLGERDFGTRPFLVGDLAVRVGRPGPAGIPVLFPYTNDVMLVAPASGSRLLHGCLPDVLREHYEAQRDEGTVSALMLATSARERDGGVDLLSSLPTREGDYLFAHLGEPAWAWSISGSPVRLPAEARFLGEDEFLVFNVGGMVARLRMEAR